MYTIKREDAPDNDNSYLSLDFAPIHSEDDYTGLQVQGAMPPELAGRVLVRVGPNPQYEPIDRALYLWFDGDGMMNFFRLGTEGVDFRNRYVHTRRYELEHSAGRALFGGIQSIIQVTEEDAWSSIGMSADEVADMKARVAEGLGPTEDQYRKIATILGNANTAYLPRDGRIIAQCEAGMPYKVDPSTLGTLGRDTFGCRIQDSLIAHPIVDPATGETFTIGYWPFAPHLNYYVIGKDGSVTHVPIGPESLPRAVMMHSFSLTEKYAIFYDLPVTFESKDFGTDLPLRWQPELGGRIGVMPRHGTEKDLRWFDLEGFDPPLPTPDGMAALFHNMNAYDEGETVVMFVCRYPRPAIVDVPPGEDPAAVFARWTLDLSTGKLVEDILYPGSCEFPTMDDRFKTRKQTQGYFFATVGLGPNTIVHYDFTTGAIDSWCAGLTRFVGEPVFTPKTKDSPEGDGYLFTLVWDALADKSALVILDAMNVAAGPVATVDLPRRIPFDFHGSVLMEPEGRPVPYVPPRGPKGVAIIGSGTAGLGAATALHRAGFDITVYEAMSEVGGNAHTVDFPTRLGYRVPVDMGVILTSPWSYPNLYALFGELDVQTSPFGVNVGGSFGPDDNWITGAMTDGDLWRKVAREAARFDQEMAMVASMSPLDQLAPLSQYVKGYSNDFVAKVLCPVLSVLVVSRSSLLQLPVGIVADLVKTQTFFAPAPWRLIEGGTRTYTSRLAATFADRIRLDSPVRSVTRSANEVIVTDARGRQERYAQVVFATTADVALALLGDPSLGERALLGGVSYDPAEVYLHSDQSILSPYLPRDTLTEYSYFGPDPQPTLQGTMTYNMEAALGVPGPLVTVYSPSSPLPRPKRVVAKKNWQHPITTPVTFAMKLLNWLIQGVNRTWFCGTYTTLPTHEAGFVSGLVVANQMGAPFPFGQYPGAQSGFEAMKLIMFPNKIVGALISAVESLTATEASSVAATFAADPVGSLAPVLRDKSSGLRVRMYPGS